MIRPFAELGATERQVQAADPQHSFWVSANAGSGKTRVLVDRVVRMLFAGTLPERILCLTYTKAAATEMQNRLFRLLGQWAMMPEDKLRDALRDLGVDRDATAEDIARARRLFAQAIGTPGGLRIQTIHSFCAALLRRFPLEAGVPPGFRELDEAETAALRAEILEDIASSDDAEVLDAVAPHVDDQRLMKLVGGICVASEDFGGTTDARKIRSALGISDNASEADLPSQMLGPRDSDLAGRIVPILRTCVGKYDLKIAAALAAARLDAPDLVSLDVLEELFLTVDKDEGTRVKKQGALPNKQGRERIGEDDWAALEDLADRVRQAKLERNRFPAAAKTIALHRFARAFLPRYQARKAALGRVDFEDLIRLTAGLLSDSRVAQWVLYRLDGGLDHILVDEAQDTSPAQWAVIRRLTEEITAGQGAREALRTLFVVGDKKQSIYSFQGADVAAFDEMRQRFGNYLRPQGRWGEGVLDHSFRSGPAILSVVDNSFDAADHAALGGPATHIAFNQNMPSRVDLWPAVEAEKPPAPEDYYLPEVTAREAGAEVRLARQIAAEISRIIASGTRIQVRAGGKVREKPVDEGDILILVQSRSRMFHAVIRACKAAGLRVAGSDRLRLGGEIAVRDLRALLRFLALPEDDLSLAEALRSPLFGWTEGQLFALASSRPQGSYLWQALRGAADQHPQTTAILDDLRGQSDFLRPYELLERALTRHGLRERLIGRLGAEAQEGIDELLTQAIDFESADIPSLTGYLVSLETQDSDRKRRFEAGTRALRVMTVHGAKGLEAPIVILPDAAKPGNNRSDSTRILRREGQVPLWQVSRAEAPDEIAERMAEVTRRDAEEDLRLLYVAMTRAESWLIVAAAGEIGGPKDSWYNRIHEGMTRSGGAQTASRDGPGAFGLYRVTSGAWPLPGAPAPAPDALPEAGPADPQALAGPPPAPVEPERVWSPSGLPGAKALPGEAGQSEEAALRHGSALHLLLEHLRRWPEADWPEIAAALLQGGEDPLDSAETDTVLAEARAVLASPVLAGLADPLSEVTLSGRVGTLGGRRFSGVVDLLSVEPDRVLAIDFKTNRTIPDRTSQVPEGILRQMGVYAELLAQIYPGKRIETAILWTANGSFMPLPPDIVRSALASTPIP